VATYGFSEGDAKRIGKVVRLVERGPDKVRLGGPANQGPVPGVRLLLAKHAATSWATGSTAVVEVYNGPPGAVASALTMVAYNHYVKFGEDTACTNRWVALGHNGFAWIAIDAQSECGTCVSEVGGVDFRSFPNYARTTEQVLGHDTNGCIKWFNTTTCATAT
jgi:hypothetical protein